MGDDDLDLFHIDIIARMTTDVAGCNRERLRTGTAGTLIPSPNAG